MIPALRTYVATILTELYTELMCYHKIESQTYENHLKRYPLFNACLNYETVNNNNAKYGDQKARYDYKIRNPVKLSKLFVPTYMSNYTGFDDICDISILLGLIVKIDKFPAIVKTGADNVRRNIRTPWIQCNFTKWNVDKYSNSFKLVEKLINDLSMSFKEEVQIIGEMNKMEINDKPTNLDDNEKRWFVVGICLHSVIPIALRKYVVPVLTELYDEIICNYKIDTQTYQTHVINYSPTYAFLNYEAVNNNYGYQKQKYDYTIRNAVELSKLFLPTNMATYTGFDETCDISTLLELIIQIDKFPAVVRKDADDVRRYIRNPWSRGDCNEWDDVKFLNAFLPMEKLVYDLNLSLVEENEITWNMSKWKINASKIIMTPFKRKSTTCNEDVEITGHNGDKHEGCHSSNCRPDYDLIAEACVCLRVKSALHYDIAKQSCINDGAQLLRIDSPLKQTYLSNTIGSNVSRLYIQGEKIGNIWTFTDGTTMEYFNWALGQPNNNHDENYMFLSPTVQYKWEDGGKGTYSFICESLL